MPPHPQDDAFHEIQLNGKQLVFLFMAATVVSVVIFLCGVLVGRGVRAERALAMADTGLTAPADTTPQQPAPTPTPAPAGSDPTAASPPPAVDDLSYFKRLEKPSPAPEQLKAPPTRAAPSVPEHAAPAPPPPPAAPAAVPGANDPGERPWAVQVTALNVRTEAEAVAKQLASKGYEAYVVLPTDGTTMYRVRVGKFKTQREAEPLKARLEKEEQLKPWITR